MKKIYIYFLLFFTFAANAQTPQGISYQAVARDSTGKLLSNQPIKIKFSIRDSISSGNIVYQEMHFDTTDALGLFDLVLGQGIVLNGTFDLIDWGKNSKYLQVDLDANTGIYTSMGIQKMMSVPYALFSGTAQTLRTSNTSGNGFTHYIGEKFGGGVIFQLWKDSTGAEHGLVVALTDQSASQAWSNVTGTTIGSGAQSSWDGLSNSNAIVAQSGHTSSAAKLCLDLVSGVYSDWYLPSVDELSLLWQNRFYVNKSLSTIGGATLLSSAYYWSSAETSNNSAWSFNYGSGNAPTNYKTNTNYVRSVRAF